MYGIIYTPLLETEVNVKNDGVPLDINQRPWLQNLPSNFIVQDDNGDFFTTGDVSLYYYIKWMYPQIDIKLLNPHEITEADVAANKINFVITYNRGEAYSFDTYDNFLKINDILQHKSIYPPQSWQKLVDHKQNMYKYLQDNGVNVLPYRYYSSSDESIDVDDIIEDIEDYAEENDVEKIIIRPEFGTISNDIGVFDMDDLETEEFEDYIDKVQDKYPGMIVTPFVEDFKTNGEFKVYFVGGRPFLVLKLLQSVETDEDGEEEGPDITLFNPSDPYVAQFVEYAQQVFARLPKITIGKDTQFPLIYTRIDLVCCYKGQIFLNEIEAVPSLLGPDKKEAPFLDQSVGDQIVQVIQLYEMLDKKEKRKNTIYSGIYIAIISIIILLIVIMILKLTRLQNTSTFS